MDESAQCQRMARQIEQALASLAVLLNGHNPSCVCCYCIGLHQAQAALDSIFLLCTIVDKQVSHEWQRQSPGPFTEIANACVRG